MSSENKMVIIIVIIVAVFLLLCLTGGIVSRVSNPLTPQENCMDQAKRLNGADDEKEAYYKCLESLKHIPEESK